MRAREVTSLRKDARTPITYLRFGVGNLNTIEFDKKPAQNGPARRVAAFFIGSAPFPAEGDVEFGRRCHDKIAHEKVHRRLEYEHPLFNLAAIAAQKELPALNRISPDQTTYYAGAWFKYGFHEDGFTSGLECARAVTGDPIWQ